MPNTTRALQRNVVKPAVIIASATPPCSRVTAAAGDEPPVKLSVCVMSACGFGPKAPLNSTTNGVAGPGPPVTPTLPAPILDRAARRVCTVAAVSFHWMAAVVCPPKVSVNEPPVGEPVIATCWISSRPLLTTIAAAGSKYRCAALLIVNVIRSDVLVTSNVVGTDGSDATSTCDG